MTLVTLLAVAAAALYLKESRKRYKENARITTSNLSQALSGDLSGDIERVDIVLQSTADELAELRWQKMSVPKVNEYLE